MLLNKHIHKKRKEFKVGMLEQSYVEEHIYMQGHKWRVHLIGLIVWAVCMETGCIR